MNGCANLDDEALVRNLKEGSDDAYTEIYNRYWKKLFVVACHKLKSSSDAEEVVQDIFLEIWSRRTTLNITCKLSSYLAAAVTYKVINVFAKRQVQLKYIEFAATNSPQADLSTLHLLSFEEMKHRLIKHVADLPEKCQLVFKLSRDEGLSHKEIAAQLNISNKTVEAHLSKATHFLKVKLTSVLLVCNLLTNIL